MAKDSLRRADDLVLGLVCLAFFMPVFDSGAVAVALPTIGTGLALSDSSLSWVTNAYMLGFGGFLLSAGRLRDLYGARSVLQWGGLVFTVSSTICGVARQADVLFIVRAAEGAGGATITAVSLSLLNSFRADSARHAKASSAYAFVWGAATSVGNVVSGLLVNGLSWHWIFLINVPIGVVVLFLCRVALPSAASLRSHQSLDRLGATIIVSMTSLAVYTAANSIGTQSDHLMAKNLIMLCVVGGLLLMLFSHLRHVKSPIIPTRLFRLRGLVAASVIGAIWSTGVSTWSMISALYLQRVLGFSSAFIGIAFVPSALAMATVSGGVSGKVILRFGIRLPICLGLTLVGFGLLLLSRAPLLGDFVKDILPGMLLVGCGGGLTSTALLIAATIGVRDSESGSASGLFYTFFVIGGALGLAILVGIAANRSSQLQHSGVAAVEALNQGYHLAQFLAGIFVMAGATIAYMLFHSLDHEAKLKSRVSNTSGVV